MKMRPLQAEYFLCSILGKVKLSLCFFVTDYHAMKAYWGVEL